MGCCATFLLILVTIILPPVGVFFVAGCGMDLLINIILTCLGYLPGHIHAFYLEYIYYERRDHGVPDAPKATFVFSERVNTGGRGYGATDRV
ncbi:hypothetical protein RUND412_007745 [Rhizina undulata]